MVGRGYYRLARGWLDHPVLRGEPFNRATAWVWMIERARWKDSEPEPDAGSIVLLRGQFMASENDLAAAWGWSKSRVHRFLAALKAEAMIDVEIRDKVAVITVKNYDRYQWRATSSDELPEPAKGAESADLGHEPNQPEPVGEPASEPAKGAEILAFKPYPNQQPNQQPNRNIRRKGKEEGKEAGGDYAFQGKVIHLNLSDFERWKKSFNTIVDLKAELESLDAWLTAHPEKKSSWFHIVASSLSRKHQKLLSEQKISHQPRRETTIPEHLA